MYLRPGLGLVPTGGGGRELTALPRHLNGFKAATFVTKAKGAESCREEGKIGERSGRKGGKQRK